jgi:hypothetical protein
MCSTSSGVRDACASRTTTVHSRVRAAPGRAVPGVPAGDDDVRPPRRRPAPGISEHLSPILPLDALLRTLTRRPPDAPAAEVGDGHLRRPRGHAQRRHTTVGAVSHLSPQVQGTGGPWPQLRRTQCGTPGRASSRRLPRRGPASLAAQRRGRRSSRRRPALGQCHRPARHRRAACSPRGVAGTGSAPASHRRPRRGDATLSGSRRPPIEGMRPGRRPPRAWAEVPGGVERAVGPRTSGRRATGRVVLLEPPVTGVRSSRALSPDGESPSHPDPAGHRCAATPRPGPGPVLDARHGAGAPPPSWPGGGYRLSHSR